MLQHSGRPHAFRTCLPRGVLVGNPASVPTSSFIGPKAPWPATPLKIRWETTGTTPPGRTWYGRPDHSQPASNGIPSDPSPAAPDKALPIRERLRRWAAEQDEQHVRSRAMPPDVFLHGSISNSLSRTQTTGSSDLDQLRSTDTALTPASGIGTEPGDADIVVPIGSGNPGDLVELRQTGSRVPIFAVYLGFFGDRNHFYAINGKWVTSMAYSSLFTLSNFATADDLAPVLAKIPNTATPDDFDHLRQNEHGPSREDGVALIRKMESFRRKSEKVYQENLPNLDGAGALLSSPHSVKYLSLLEMADTLLPSSLKAQDGFPAPALYAVHTAIYRSEGTFSPLSPSADCHRRDHLFQVLPRNYADVLNKITVMVRQYTEFSAKRLKPLGTTELQDLALGRFVLQAREAVSNSRLHREWTPHGILKASPGVELQKTEWAPSSKDVIAFLEWWACYGLFDSASRFHSYGALVLRALDLYGNSPLDQSTAWAFLQEIGVIAPWEIPSRYRVRLPGVTIARGGGLNREAPNLKESKRADVAAGARKHRSGAPIFCIDAPSTMVIDDAVSLEATDKADEFWIHVHVADPSSSIRPSSELGRFMELVPENIYLPGHFQAMLPSELGEEDAKDYKSDSLVKQFSLRPGAPALTFSALVDGTGDILEYKVEPSTLDDVTYLDPDDVAKFCNEPPPPPYAGHSLAVGAAPECGPTAPQRPMLAVQDLDESSRAELLTLYRLAEAIKQRRLAKGAWPYFFPRPSVLVSFHDTPKTDAPPGLTTVVPADPYIRVGQDPSSVCSVVSNAMVLAGEVAARWCSSRGIPIPYRKDAKSAKNFDAAFSYAMKEVYPLIEQGIEPSASQRQALSRLTGGMVLSPQPGPYFLLGLDMYAKATSPLRRFSDLLVHWQIHAALAYERQTRRRIDAAVDKLDDILPFTTASLGHTLGLLQMREKMARTVSRGTVDWILIALVRAWRFEGNAPRSLRFTVGSRWRQGLFGRLDLFGLNAVLDVAGLDGVRLIKDVQVGDQFEVELADVNVHSRQVVVKATRYLGGAENNT